MVGQHHQLNGHELVQTLGDSEGQGGLVWSSPWGCKGSDMSYGLNKHHKQLLYNVVLVSAMQQHESAEYTYVSSLSNLPPTSIPPL